MVPIVLSNLPTALAAVTRIDPLTYGIDGLRGAFIGAGHFAAATEAAVLSGVAVLFITPRGPESRFDRGWHGLPTEARARMQASEGWWT